MKNKQAILITAYKDLDFINHIISCFDEDFFFFIHIDKKCTENTELIKKNDNITIVSKYNIYWGGYNHLAAILYLLKLAYQQGFIYYHLITGSDFPIKSDTEFKSFFEHTDKAYLEFFKLPRSSWYGNGGLDRISYYWFGNDRHDIRFSGKMTYFYLKVQRKLGIRRQFNHFPNIYGGGSYWSLPHNAVNCIMSYLDNHASYIYRFHHTHCSEEIFFQTILVNLEYPIENNSLRFSKWEDNAASPSILSEKDYDTIINSNCFFARKLQNGISDQLRNRINDLIHN